MRKDINKMNAGLPGTGLGGLLYLLLVALMPIRESLMLLRGKSSWLRWNIVGRMCVMGGAIIAALFAEWWFLGRTFDYITSHTEVTSRLHHSSLIGARTVVPSMAYAPFIALGALIIAMPALHAIIAQPQKIAPNAPAH
jgi:hypothetical protein